MQFQEPTEAQKKLSIRLYQELCQAGFTTERVRLQSLLVDYIENLYQNLYDKEQYKWLIAGSFGDVWGNNLFTLDGRTDEHESDVDWTCVMRQSKFHFKETCKCQNVDERYLLSIDKVNEGHVQFNFEQLREPAEPHEGIGLRPKVDECTAYFCCSVPSEILCDRVGLLFNKEEAAGEMTLIQASRPGHQNTELRFGFAFFERRQIRSLTVIQGQLFLLIKYFITNKLNANVFALKSYHAKTLLFFMLYNLPANHGVWKGENLVSLLLYSFDFLIRQIRERKSSRDSESGFHAAMPSFFLKDCFIYFHKKVFSSCPHDSLIQVIEDVKKNIDSHISEYINLLRPIKDEQRGMIFHPYVLFPTRLTLQFCKPASADNLYLRMYNCLQELTVLTADRKIDFLRHVESLPPNTFTACLCLKVMTHLKFDNKNAAVELLRKHQFHCAQYSVPFRNISEEESKEPAIFDKLKAEIESTDTAWCFAFTYDQIRPFNFEFLNEELYDNCITRSKTYPVDVVVDFNCLTRLFYFLLCEDQSVLEKWKKDLIAKKAPLSEVYLCHYLKTSHLPLSEQLPKILRRLNESIKKNVYDRNFLTRLVERFDSERRKIFCEWLDANIESAEFVTLYCASIVSGKALLSKAVKRAFQISEKALHYQDFIMLLEMQQRLCKFDHDYLDTWWARLTGLEERNLLNVEEIISFLESANAEKSERHLNSALSLIQKFEKVLRFLKLKDFQVLMQARKRLAELDSGYLNTWLKDFNTRVNDPENSHRVPFFIVELISLSNCLKTSHNPSDIKLFTKLTEKILRLGGLSKSDAARVKRVKFTLSKLG